MPYSALSSSISGMFTLQHVVLDNAKHRFITKIYFSFSLQRSIKLSPIHNTNEHYAFIPAYNFISYPQLHINLLLLLLFYSFHKESLKVTEKKNINSKSTYSLTHCVLHSSSASLLLLVQLFKNSKYLNLKVTEVM